MAYSFGGGATTDRIQVAYGTNLTAFTIFATIFPTSFGGGNLGRIVDRSSATDTGALFALYTNNNSGTSSLTLSRGYVSGGATQNWDWGSTITANTLYRVALSHTGTRTDDPILYVNGTLRTITTRSNTAGTNPLSVTTDIVIGNRINPSINRAFAGWIAEPVIYNAVLDPKFLQAYSSGWSPRSLPGTNRIIYLPLVRNANDLQKNTTSVTGTTATSSHPSTFSPSIL